MNRVVDVSVVMRWYFPESGSEASRQLLGDYAAQDCELFAPDLIVPELLNVLWTRVRRGECSAAEAQAIRELWGDEQPELLASSTLAARGLLLATAFQHSVYGCLYLAAAIELRAVLVTADRILARLAKRVLPEVQLIR